VQCDGTYKAGTLNSKTKTIDNPALTGNIDALQPFADSHHLVAAAKGQTITFLIDGKEVGKIDGTSTAGDVGLYAISAKDGVPMNAGVTAFTVWEPK
jgi:hypothetical protein